MAASASSSPVPQEKYHVFISFRGSDVRRNFLSHLKKELDRRKIYYYVDERLEKGDEISTALMDAIEASKISLVIFSKDYASSKWCLEELVKIMECKEANGQIVIPVFHNVDPSDVRHQKRSYAGAFAQHEQKFNKSVMKIWRSAFNKTASSEKLQVWRSSLTKAANLSGYHYPSNFQDESKLIDEIVKDVLKKLNVRDTVDVVERFSCLSSLPTNVTSSANVMLFESTEWAFDTLLEALKDGDCHIICLYGIGGCGKTTLAKEVGRRAEELKLFDKVIFTVFSQSPNVRKVQGEIADVLGLSPLNEESKAGRAKRLSLGLQNGGRVLVILDDVWGMLNLEDFGIPLDGNLKGCKILLTTRLQQLCSLMNGQRNVQLQLLSTEEAWAFFQKKACITEDSSLINTVAQEIAAECKGLPIAIQAVATTLKGKPLHSWKDELDKLRHSKPIGVDQGVKDTFTCLQYSYDALMNQEAKHLFLMCSIFPEDHEMYREDLFRYGVGLGLFGEDDSFNDLRCRVNATLTNLLDNSLLMHCERGEDYFKIHDVVRDFALWKSSEKDWCVIVDCAKGINSLALDGVVKNCSAIHTWCTRRDNLFPPQLDNPKLEIILLNSYNSFDLSQASFKGIDGLKVMALIGVSFSFSKVSLLQSTQWPTNLRTLRLVRCDLGDISFVVCLKRLEILDLHGSGFKLLPKGIEELRKLKLLDLRYCKINENCDEVIRRCSQLEELYVHGVEASSGKCLIYSQTYLLDDVCFPNYQKYILEMGKFKEKKNISLSSSSRALYLGEANISTLNTFAKDLMQRAEAVYLENLHGGCKNIFPELVVVVGSMNHLIELSLECCLEIESIFCSTSTQAYCNLRQLRIFNCPMLTSLLPTSASRALSQLEVMEIEGCSKLRHIVQNEGQSATDKGEGIFQASNASHFMFPKLKSLKVRHCAMTSLLSMSAVGTLLQLEVMEIEGCSELRHIVKDEGPSATDKGEGIFQASNASYFMFPKLKSLKVRHCAMTSLLMTSAVGTLSQLEVMEIEGCSELRHIVKDAGPCAADKGEGIFQASNASHFMFPKLKSLRVRHCGMASLFPTYAVGTLSRLEVMEIEGCSELRHIVKDNGPSATNKGEGIFQASNASHFCFPKLKSLKVKHCAMTSLLPMFVVGTLSQLEIMEIEGCSELRHIVKDEGLSATNKGEGIFQVSNASHFMFPKLKSLKVRHCAMTALLSMSVVGTLSQLEIMEIEGCSELRHIVKDEGPSTLDRGEGIFQASNASHFMFPKLKSLKVRHCAMESLLPTSVVGTLSQLEIMEIEGCSELRHIVKDAGPSATDKGEGIFQASNASHFMFPKLKSLRVRHCGMASLFPKYAVGTMSRLEVMEIEGCSELRHIVKDEGPSVADNGEGIYQASNAPHFMFPKLKSLKVRHCAMTSLLLTTAVGTLLQLEVMEIEGCSELRHIVKDDGPSALDKGEGIFQVSNASHFMFPKLKSLKVRHCAMESLLPTSVVGTLSQLEIMEIEGCSELRHIVKDEGRSATTKGVGIFQVSNASHFMFPKLRSLKVRHCAMTSLLPMSVVGTLSQLEIMEIEGCSELRHIVKDEGPSTLDRGEGIFQASNVSHFMFPKLKSLKVRHCAMTSLLSMSVVGTLSQLEIMEIEGCSELRHIVKDEELSALDRGEGIFQASNASHFIFPKLKSLKVRHCAMESLLTTSVIGTLSQLEIMEIEGCSELRHIVKDEGPSALDKGEGMFQASNASNFMFPKMKSLKVRHCAMESLLLTSVVGTLSQLEIMEIEGCSELRHIVKDEGRSATNQGEGIFQGSNASHFMFPKLRSLKVRHCAMTSLLPMSVVGTLSQLEIMEIEGCSELRHIVKDEGPSTLDRGEGIFQASNVSHFMFPKLKSLKVRHCAMTSLLSMSVVGTLSQLEIMEIEGCSELRHIVKDEELSALDRGEGIFQASNASYFMFPKLKSLKVRHCAMTSLLMTSAVGTLSQLEVMEIEGCSELRHIVKDEGPCATDKGEGIFQASNASHFMFPKLKSLRVRHCGMASLFPTYAVGTLSRLEVMEIEGCSELKHIVKDNGPSATNKGEGIFQASNASHFCFPKLKSLKVKHCTMTSLLPISAARTLSQLEVLEIEGCSKLRHIVKDEGPGATDKGEGIFQASNAKHFLFPKLKSLKVRHCAMTSLLLTSAVGSLSQLEVLEIEGCSELRHIVKDEGPIATDKGEGIFQGSNASHFMFPKLKSLKVRHCAMTSLLMTSAIGTLSQLEVMEIEGCSELRHIVQDDGLSATDKGEGIFEALNASNFMFPKLKKLEVRYCAMLTSLLPMSAVGTLSQLEAIEIEGCSELMHIVKDEGQSATNTGEGIFQASNALNFVFPKLKTLRVQYCEKLQPFQLRDLCSS